MGRVSDVTSNQEHEFRFLLVLRERFLIVARKMPIRCVVRGCSNTRDLEKGIALHTIPFYEDDRFEAKKRRKRWVDFVKAKSANFHPSRYSVICSKHFKPDDFASRLVGKEEMLLNPWLKRDDFGISAFPSIHTANIEAEKQQSVSAANRDRRMVSYSFKQMFSALKCQCFKCLKHESFFSGSENGNEAKC